MKYCFILWKLFFAFTLALPFPAMSQNLTSRLHSRDRLDQLLDAGKLLIKVSELGRSGPARLTMSQGKILGRPDFRHEVKASLIAAPSSETLGDGRFELHEPLPYDERGKSKIAVGDYVLCNKNGQDLDIVAVYPSFAFGEEAGRNLEIVRKWSKDKAPQSFEMLEIVTRSDDVVGVIALGRLLERERPGPTTSLALVQNKRAEIGLYMLALTLAKHGYSESEMESLIIGYKNKYCRSLAADLETCLVLFDKLEEREMLNKNVRLIVGTATAADK